MIKSRRRPREASFKRANERGIKVVFLPIVIRRNGRATVSSDTVLRLVKVDMKGERRGSSTAARERAHFVVDMSKCFPRALLSLIVEARANMRVKLAKPSGQTFGTGEAPSNPVKELRGG